MKEALVLCLIGIKEEVAFFKETTKNILKEAFPPKAETKEPAWGECSGRTWGGWNIDK